MRRGKEAENVSPREVRQQIAHLDLHLRLEIAHAEVQVKRERIESDAQLRKVVEGKMSELMEAIECSVCMDRPAATAFSCGHCYCCHSDCGSSYIESCPACAAPVQSRTKLFMYDSVQGTSSLQNLKQQLAKDAALAKERMITAQYAATMAEKGTECAGVEKDHATLTDLWRQKCVALEAKTQENARLVQQQSTIAASQGAAQQKQIAMLEQQLAGKEVVQAALAMEKQGRQQMLVELGEENNKEIAKIEQEYLALKDCVRREQETARYGQQRSVIWQHRSARLRGASKEAEQERMITAQYAATLEEKKKESARMEKDHATLTDLLRQECVALEAKTQENARLVQQQSARAASQGAAQQKNIVMLEQQLARARETLDKEKGARQKLLTVLYKQLSEKDAELVRRTTEWQQAKILSRQRLRRWNSRFRGQKTGVLRKSILGRSIPSIESLRWSSSLRLHTQRLQRRSRIESEHW